MTDYAEDVCHKGSTDFKDGYNFDVEYDYDALGNIIPDLSSNVDFQPYAFNGKELDKTFGLNLHDFGFRNYDSALGRWTSMDRKSEDYASTTPYAFCLNNFANGMDPFGLDYWSTINPDAIRRFMEGINASKMAGKLLGWGGVSISVLDLKDYIQNRGTNTYIYKRYC